MNQAIAAALSIEMDQCAIGYGHVHRAGCKDLGDELRIGDAVNRSEIGRLVEEATGWDEHQARVAPCVNLPK